MKKYSSEKEIKEIVRGFETGTISRDDWKHAEHLAVACFYALQYDPETAYAKMRGGIFSLLAAFNVDLTKEMPYHETITRFWMQIIFDILKDKNGYSIVKFTNEALKICGDKDLPLKYYSRELLFSEKARTEFVAPDLQEF